MSVPIPALIKNVVGYVSWGLQDSEHGFDVYSNNPDQLVDEMIADGFWGVCIQIIDENVDGAVALHAACQRRNFQLHFSGWTNAPQVCQDEDQMRHIFDLMKKIKVGSMNWNIEERWGLGGTQLDNPDTVNNCHKTLISNFRKLFPKMPATVQTNFGGFELRSADGGIAGGMDHAASAIYNKAQVWCNHEDYWVNNTNLTPASGDWNADQGWNGTGCKFRQPTISTAGIFPSETGRTDANGERLQNHCVDEIPRLIASGRHHFEHTWTLEYFNAQDRKLVGTRF